MHILGLPTDIFNVYPATIKFKTYQARWQIGDIYVSGDARKTEDNPQGLGCYLVMTGRGCDDIFRILDSRNYTFGDMFRRCERRYGLDNFHFTRLDIAIDDKNEKPFFTIEQIKKKCEKEEFISNSEGYKFDESKFDDFDTAKTVYIGAGKSGLSYRFYDKDKEVCSKYNKSLDEVGSWKRTEMQLRDEKAHAFAMTFKDRPLELGELAFGLLANNLRFVVPNRNESNKIRWKTCRFWERFLGAVEVLKLQVPKQHNSLEETQQRLYTDRTQLSDYRTRLGIVGWGLFAGAEYASADKRFTASAGLRADGCDYSGRMARVWRQLSPRASVSYAVSPGWSVSGSAGLYCQLPPYTALGFKEDDALVNRSLDYMRVGVFSAGVDWRLRYRLIVSVEG